MALRVVSQQLNDRTGTVTIEGDGQEEVMSHPAKQLALQTATAGGISRPGLSGNESVYPVDAEGNSSDALVLGQAGKAHAFRCDYKIQGGL
jgi:hypothetical protein